MRRAWLGFIVLVYLTLGALFALGTPPWQVPDEPAHFNYLVHVARTGTLPELRPGDYPADYLEELKARRFPPEMSIEGVRYEAHQPPLYYVLAAGAMRLTAGLPLDPLHRVRLFSVALGLGVILLSYGVTRALLPHRPELALGVAAFAATQPMHLTMIAAANNDVLVGVWINGVALLILTSARWSIRRSALLGLLMGLALLTKMQSYVTLAIVGSALIYDTLLVPPRPRWALCLGRGALMLGVAALVALPWLARNMVVYGTNDPLALVRHDQIVTGQLTSTEYIALHGWPALLRALIQTTFRSFWGQFGWMGVVLPPRFYQALGGVSLLGAVGLAWRVGGARATGAIRRHRRAGLILLAWVVMTAAGYLWWNTRYLQHQGRYLFPALTPLALGLLLGIETLLEARPRPVLVGGGVALLAMLALGLARGQMPLFGLALVVAACLALLAGQALQRRSAGLPLALLLAAQAAFSLLCLYAYIIPALRP
jgi:4-amino-4-deoxy-L-arabinose transferase-like glycosyltransferase